jgi:ParB/RepB/Spo0J family partition protein
LTAAIAEMKKAPLEMPSDANSASQNIPVDRILRSPFNRKPELNEDFIANVRQYGVLQPIIVREVKIGLDRLGEIPASTPVSLGEKVYEIVAGERRWLASKKTNKATIPAIIRELTDLAVMEIQIVENDHREDYSILDRAESYANLRAKHMEAHKGEKGWTEEKCMDLIASRLNQENIKGRTVQQIIALRKLEWQVQGALRNDELEASHGYEICRRPAEEQIKLLAWIRQQTQHSQGDVPTVRRLKLEIRNMDIAADEKRRQEKLFKEGPGASAKLTFDGKTIDLAPGPLPGSVRTALLKTYPDLSTTAHFLQDGRIQLARGLTGKPFYLTVDQLQKLLNTGVLHAADPAQTSAPARDWPLQTAKPLSKKQLDNIAKANAKAEEQVQRNIQQNLKAQRDQRRNALIDRKYRALFFTALAKKAHVCSRLLTHLIPDMLFELWERDAVPPEGFAPDLLQWPAPKRGDSYDYSEVKQHANKHTRKYSGNLLSALLIFQHMALPDAERMAKYFGVDVKKLRQRAATAVKEEDAKASAGKKGAKA